MTGLSLFGAAGQAGLGVPYRAIWRRHFVSGRLVIPFVLLLAIPGGIHICKDETSDVLHHNLRIAPAT